jgi:hypothetical protein
MSFANFEGLCKGLCELAGVEVPDLVPGVDGGLAIEVALNEVRVVLSYDSASHADRVVFAVTFGPLPDGRALDACRVLMNLNTHVLASGSTFGRDPATGDMVLAQSLAFGQATAVDVYQRIVMLVEIAAGWRQHHFLAEAGQDIVEEALQA